MLADSFETTCADFCRQLSSHATGTLGVSLSLRDGTITLSETWSRQLSEDTTGNVSCASAYPAVALLKTYYWNHTGLDHR